MTSSEPRSQTVWHGLHSYHRSGSFSHLSEQSKTYYFPVLGECYHKLVISVFLLKLVMLRQNRLPPAVTHRARALRPNRLCTASSLSPATDVLRLLVAPSRGPRYSFFLRLNPSLPLKCGQQREAGSSLRKHFWKMRKFRI